MPVLRFVQISDLHPGAPFGWLPPERRGERRREQQCALEAAVGLAIERGAAAILVPGDLFDAEGVDADTLAQKPVTLGVTAGGWVEVLEGVREREQVVVSGHANLRPGARVRVSPGAAPQPAVPTP